ncbi:MAG: lysylphosphatidylglycerol synthase domain-containing protein [Acidiferrobacter sp.]
MLRSQSRFIWRPSWTRWLLAAAALLGAATAVALVVHAGWRMVFQTIERAGFGLLWLIPLRLVTVGLDTRGWQALLKTRRQAPWRILLWLGLVRDAVNTLLPVARVGGELVAIRLLGLRGVKMSTASASVIVETSVTLVLQVLLTLAGIMVLLPYVGAGPLVPQLLLVLVFAVLTVVAFLVVQVRVGLVTVWDRVMARFMSRPNGPRLASFRGLDQKVLILYRHRGALLRCAGWQLVGFVGNAAEIWLLAHLMHVSLSLGRVFIFESLIQAVHSVSFAVPGALGIQEGGFVVLGAVLGVNPDVALSIALGRRLRQIAIGLPVLGSWQWFERRHKRPDTGEALSELPAVGS